MSIRMHAGQRVSSHVSSFTRRSTRPHPRQSVCTRLTGPQPRQRVCVCKQHDPNPSSAFARRPTRLHASKCISSHTSASAGKQTCPWSHQYACKAGPLLRYFFSSICFVSLTICSQPRQCLHASKQVHGQVSKSIFFCFFHSTNHLFSSSLTLPPLSNYLIHVDIHVVVRYPNILFLCSLYW